MNFSGDSEPGTTIGQRDGNFLRSFMETAMKKIILISALIALHFFSSAQFQQDILNLKPDSAIEGIKALKIASDKNSSSFIIWIKEEVKAHKHGKHTENIYILEGEGELKLQGHMIKVKPGDYFNIPENTVHSLKVTSPVPMKVLSIQSPEFSGEDRIFVEE